MSDHRSNPLPNQGLPPTSGSAPTQNEPNSHRVLITVVTSVLALLLVVMLVSWDYSSPNDDAYAKADELVAAFQDAGLQTPEVDQVVYTLGEDGGEVCALADKGLLRGYLETRLGVGGEFYFRPTIVKRDAVAGMVAVVSVYCPENLAKAQDFVDGLKLDDSTSG